MDHETTLQDLKTAVKNFIADRNWESFHNPKNVAMSIAIEAAEIMEHFQWISMDASCEIKDDPVRQAAVGEELADVIAYALAMANVLGLDVSDTVSRKMQKNAIKYPAEEFRGRFGSQPEY